MSSVRTIIDSNQLKLILDFKSAILYCLLNGSTQLALSATNSADVYSVIIAPITHYSLQLNLQLCSTARLSCSQ